MSVDSIIVSQVLMYASTLYFLFPRTGTFFAFRWFTRPSHIFFAKQIMKLICKNVGEQGDHLFILLNLSVLTIWDVYLKFPNHQGCTNDFAGYANCVLKVSISKKKELAYLDYKLESTSNISIAANHNHNINITDPHVKEGTASYLPNRTCAKFFCLHNMHPERINHISPA